MDNAGLKYKEKALSWLGIPFSLLYYRSFLRFVSMTFVENRFDVSFLLLEIERICQLTKFHQNLAPAIATFIKKARTFHPGVLFQSFSFFRITEKKKEGENQSLPPPLSFPSHMKLRITGAASLRVLSLSLSEMTFG